MLPMAELESRFLDDVSSGLEHLRLGSEPDATTGDSDNLGKNGEA